MTSKKNPPKLAADDAEQLEIQTGRRAPFTMAPDWILFAPVTRDAKVLYWALAAHVSQSRDDFDVWPTQDQLATLLGYAKRQNVADRLTELLQIGAIDTRTIRTHGGMRQRTIYTVHQTPPPQWNGPESLTDFYRSLKEQTEESSQVTPEVPHRGPPGVPHEGRRGVPHEEPRSVPCEGQEPDQPELDEYEPDQPTNGGPTSSTDLPRADAADGWMAVENKHEAGTGTDMVMTPGDQLLASIERRNRAPLTAQRAEHVATVDAALETLTRDQVMSELSDGLDGAHRPAGALVGRIRQLPERVAQRQAERQHRAERDRRLNEREHKDRQSRTGTGTERATAVASKETQASAMETVRQLLATQKGGTQVSGPSRNRRATD